MSGLSDRTLAILIEAGERHFPARELKTLLMRNELYKYSTGENNNKADLLRSRLLGAREAAQEGDTDAARGMLTFTAELVERALKIKFTTPPWFGELCDALRADGFELAESSTGAQGGTGYVILPTDPAPVPLAPEISALEAELDVRGYTSVLNHYRQAVDGFTNHKYESANGDLRTTLEDLVTRLAEDYGYQRQPRAGQGGAAITHMIQNGYLREDDGGQLLRGLWKLSCANGSHPGQSDADEARFRMQVITATARFLLRHFPART